MNLKSVVEFDSAHRLSFHKGKCKNLHGHRWKVEITIKTKDSVRDIIVDFGSIKEFINSNFDHKVLIFVDDKIMMDVAAILESSGCDCGYFNFELTAENLAICIRDYIFDLIKRENKNPLSCDIGIKLWETPNNCIEV